MIRKQNTFLMSSDWKDLAKFLRPVCRRWVLHLKLACMWFCALVYSCTNRSRSLFQSWSSGRGFQVVKYKKSHVVDWCLDCLALDSAVDCAFFQSVNHSDGVVCFRWKDGGALCHGECHGHFDIINWSCGSRCLSVTHVSDELSRMVHGMWHGRSLL